MMKNSIRQYRPGLVSLVIPAKNEAEAIGETLSKLPFQTLHAAGFDTEVVLLDGNSDDGTAEIAARHGAMVLSDPEPGKGAAFRNGRAFFRGDYVVMLDADGTYAADAIPRTVNRLAWGEADVVMGERRTLPGAMSPANRIGNKLLSFGASVLYGRRCRDVCTGLWGFRADALRALPLTCSGFELEAELFALASRLDLRIDYVQVDYLPRKGETKLSPTRDGLRIGWSLLHNRFGPLDAAACAVPDPDDPPRQVVSLDGVNGTHQNGRTEDPPRAGEGRRGPAPDVTVPVEAS